MTVSRRIVLVFLALSLIAGAATGSGIYYQLAYLWFFLYFGSWVLSYSSLAGLSISRSSRTLRAQVGQLFEERFVLSNNSRFMKLWVEVRDESTIPGSEGSRIVTLIDKRQSRSYLARTRLTRRGVFDLGPTVLASSDLFGLFPIEKRIMESDSILVYPYMVEIENFPDPPGLLPGGESLRRKTYQVTASAAGIREYVHGDSLNRIHWLSSARKNQLMVKEFELDPMADVWIFFDAYIYNHFANKFEEPVINLYTDLLAESEISLPPETEEYGISAAASLARYCLSRGRAVGLVSSGQQNILIPPDRGGRQLGKILESLALLKASGSLPLRTLIESQVKHIARGSTVILITPIADRATIILVDFLLQRGLRPVPIIMDIASFGGGADESINFVNGMKALSVPFRKIKCGENLALSLSTII